MTELAQTIDHASLAAVLASGQPVRISQGEGAIHLQAIPWLTADQVRAHFGGMGERYFVDWRRRNPPGLRRPDRWHVSTLSAATPAAPRKNPNRKIR